MTYIIIYIIDRPIFSKISNEAKNLLAGMLQVDPRKRLSASECLLHPWITGTCHNDKHLAPLPEVQEHFIARMQRQKK